MKKIIYLFLLGFVTSQAQNTHRMSMSEYQLLKDANRLGNAKNITIVNDAQSRNSNQLSVSRINTPNTTCGCAVPFDSTFSVVPFLNSLPPEYRNDDSFTAKLGLPFTFCFYGQNFDSLYINNNGNISFTSQYYTFTADSFPSLNFNMLAPFWGDVDTRDNISGGLVYYKLTPTSLIVRWDSVDVFPSPNGLGLRNTFQLIITDGTDPILPNGSNVAFCYGDMQWTTGNASGGSGGFGGTPATVGANQGNGIDYFQVGRYNQQGSAFDGPYGNADGVDFLDNQNVYFDVCNTGNLPPIIINSVICDTIDVYSGDTIRVNMQPVMFNLKVSTPEINQMVSVSFSGDMGTNFTSALMANSATYKEYECSIDVANLPSGYSHLYIQATDNGVPSQVSNQLIVVNKTDAASALNNIKNSAVDIYPNPAQDIINIRYNGIISDNNEMKIYNVTGQLEKSVNINSNNQTVSISDLNQGIYFARLIVNGKAEMFKFIKK